MPAVGTMPRTDSRKLTPNNGWSPAILTVGEIQDIPSSSAQVAGIQLCPRLK